MSAQPYIKVTVIHLDDGSLFYHHMKNYERVRTYITSNIWIEDNHCTFSVSGQGHTFPLDKYRIKMEPIL